ncbi:major facilitator superfamily transporter [Tanticharoenia sakaeratensis NBRC 103193]|nr:major facilitator superfamily transporter [Tanticharoenia sakaeratensis NBRC 103193]
MVGKVVKEGIAMQAEGTPVDSPTRRILLVVLFNLLIYIDIGLPMAVIPVFVHRTLLYSATVAGLAISLQYFATFAFRPSAGQRTDRIGPKPVVVAGLALGVVSGTLLMLAGFLAAWPVLSLALLAGSRVILGWAESWTATAVIYWNIRRVGSANTAQAISWNGVCSYGGIALGAPVGELLSHLSHPFGGVTTVGLLSLLLPAFGLSVIWAYDNVQPTVSKRPLMKFTDVFKRVFPHGAALALGSIGFGAISSYLALYYAAMRWGGAADALAAFGAVFVLVRFVLSRQIGRFGGTRVAVVSLVVEAVGLMMLWRSGSSTAAAMGAAITGAGFSLVFPALGVLAVDRAGPENRGAALGAFSVFLDLAIGFSGPALGLVAEYGGYPPLFLLAGACSVGGAIVSQALGRPAARRR